jgi:uncharacterized protein with PIN domain
MRNLVQPPPSMHCELCDGELRLRLIEPVDSVLDMEVHNFVCAKCGREYSYMVIHDRYAARTTRSMSGAR